MVDQLLDEIKESCTLTKLGLVEAQLQNIHIEKIKLLIRNAKLLRELDLSWNALGQAQMLEITKELATNRILTFVNLSWNYLTVSQKVTTMP